MSGPREIRWPFRSALLNLAVVIDCPGCTLDIESERPDGERTVQLRLCPRHLAQLTKGWRWVIEEART